MALRFRSVFQMSHARGAPHNVPKRSPLLLFFAGFGPHERATVALQSRARLNGKF